MTMQMLLSTGLADGTMLKGQMADMSSIPFNIFYELFDFDDKSFFFSNFLVFLIAEMKQLVSVTSMTLWSQY